MTFLRLFTAVGVGAALIISMLIVQIVLDQRNFRRLERKLERMARGPAERNREGWTCKE